jgi:hypothetical protein
LEKATARSAVVEVEKLVLLAFTTILRPRAKVNAKSLSEPFEKAKGEENSNQLAYSENISQDKRLGKIVIVALAHHF